MRALRIGLTVGLVMLAALALVGSWLLWLNSDDRASLFSLLTAAAAFAGLLVIDLLSESRR